MKLLILSLALSSASCAYLPTTKFNSPPIQQQAPVGQNQSQAQLPPQFSQPPVMNMQPHVMYTPMSGTAPMAGPQALLTNMDFLTKMGNLAYGMGVKFAQGMEESHKGGQNQPTTNEAHIAIEPENMPNEDEAKKQE
ncbi:hypothetical protein CONCODRAFT_71413 [Conidiobolus coronatus NRRL 28638]|uniref:Uncharacterized protein n=1 Tax=Conidiobolus coronatus (strain ATCC 28846 / CBS 209.66 / NRRL 28638) TaxID=796925 RepID=A0A137P371_CONC2|nr:hypothetical protein CONCODRAFT_71413 [Conidiobolus coronatus NRRL 28638]|eukprot:KXN69487.1 hypothetical protein CONCODRAFT_71413 [Conidiobolus coronatus NRRL 28638]